MLAWRAHKTYVCVRMCICVCMQREGNVLMSYNNRPATDAIPFLSPILAPSARAVGPLLEQLATSPLRCVFQAVFRLQKQLR